MKDKRRRTEIKIVLLLAYISVMAWATPAAVLLCYIERSGFAIGGEWAGLLLIPFAVYELIRTYVNMISCTEVRGKHRYETD